MVDKCIHPSWHSTVVLWALCEFCIENWATISFSINILWILLVEIERYICIRSLGVKERYLSTAYSLNEDVFDSFLLFLMNCCWYGFLYVTFLFYVFLNRVRPADLLYPSAFCQRLPQLYTIFMVDIWLIIYRQRNICSNILRKICCVRKPCVFKDYRGTYVCLSPWKLENVCL